MGTVATGRYPGEEGNGRGGPRSGGRIRCCCVASKAWRRRDGNREDLIEGSLKNKSVWCVL